MFNISDLKSDFLNQFQLLEVSMLGDKDIEDRLQSLFGPMSREENSMSRWLSTEASRLFPNRMELIELRNALDKVFELGSRILILGGQLQECHAQVMLSDDEQFSRQVEEYEAEIQTTMQSFRGVHHRIFLLLDALFRDPHGKGHFKDACGTMEQLEEAVQENDGVELF
ncbi:MAG: hypothetical protein G8345_13700 [Magnetococcales bacterium]|nr:hypothetical protein [Magnetococcales bacterium]NGZ27929.1 hypothetical protein [Magnetococcales bacterium]